MKKKILLYGFILTMIITLLSGCSSSGRKDIIGKWTVTNIESKSSNNFLESLQYSLLKMLFSPGTVMEFYDTKVSVAMNSMDYKWIKENTIQIGNDKGEDAPIIFDVEIDKESMTLSNSMVSIYLVKGESDHIGEDKASLDKDSLLFMRMPIRIRWLLNSVTMVLLSFMWLN